MNKLGGKRIAVIATNGFEESELIVPVNALRSEGATVDIIAPEKEPIRGWKDESWTESIEVDRTIGEANSLDYDALIIPGGVINCDQLRLSEQTIVFVREFFDAAKPVAAICHGPQLLIEAGVASGRELTSYASLRTDLENAGALWVDEPVVVDRGLVTSRTPADLAAFVARTIETVTGGVQEQQNPRT